MTPNTPNDIIAQLEHQETIFKEPQKILCAHCQNRIAFINDIVIVGQNAPINTFINPHGYVHEVLTVERVQNIRIHGMPEAADTWFPGFMWRFLHCNECKEHLGWAYFRPLELQLRFAGLSMGNIIIEK